MSSVSRDAVLSFGKCLLRNETVVAKTTISDFRYNLPTAVETTNRYLSVFCFTLALSEPAVETGIKVDPYVSGKK